MGRLGLTGWSAFVPWYKDVSSPSLERERPFPGALSSLYEHDHGPSSAASKSARSPTLTRSKWPLQAPGDPFLDQYGLQSRRTLHAQRGAAVHNSWAVYR